MTWIWYFVLPRRSRFWSAARSSQKVLPKKSAPIVTCVRSILDKPHMVKAMMTAIELKGVSAGYGDTVVLEDICLALAPGESISVIGRNGVGKTTLLATVMGHTRLRRGDILLDGV